MKKILVLFLACLISSYGITPGGGLAIAVNPSGDLAFLSVDALGNLISAPLIGQLGPPFPGGQTGVAIDPDGNIAFLHVDANGALLISGGGGGGSGTVTSVSFTGGLISVATPTVTPAFTVAGTSGGIPYFSSASTWASSGALLANRIVIGGGAGAAPSTTTTGTGVLTALGINVGSAGAFVTFNGAGGTPSAITLTNGVSLPLSTGITGFGTGIATALAINTGSAGAPVLLNGALGTPSSGTVTNLTGTASININGTVGATTPAAGTFTTITAGSATSLLLGTAGSAVGSVGFRNATSGTITLTPPTGGLGTVSNTLQAAADTFVYRATTDTLTNKRVTARVITITSSATPTVNTDNYDVVSITAQAADITSMSTNLTGSAQPFDQLEYAITGTGARAITWNSSGTNFTAGPVALPTTTVTTKTLHVYFERDAANTTWLCMASSSDS